MITVNFIGHLGGDATLSNVNGRSVINFNAAHSESYTDANGNKVNKSIWVSCSYWVEKTTIAQYLKKGTQIYLEGQPSVDTYTKDGKVFPQLRVRVSQIQLLGSNPNTQQPSSKQSFNNHLGGNKTEFDSKIMGYNSDITTHGQ